MRELLGPDVWACSVRATAKGHLSGVPVGDPLTMPGLFLVENNAIIWRHRFRHIGDHPSFARIAEEAARASVKDSGTIRE